MSNDPLDFGPLDPTRDARRFDWIVAETLDRARPELARRAMPSPWRQLVGWSRPTLAAAGLAAIASAAILSGGTGALPETSALPAVEAPSLSALLDDWLLEARMPTANEMVMAFNEEYIP
jgi:hypothetical protein